MKRALPQVPKCRGRSTGPRSSSASNRRSKEPKRQNENEAGDLVRKKRIGSPRILRRRTIGLCGDAESNFPPTQEALMIAYAICEFMMRTVDERIWS